MKILVVGAGGVGGYFGGMLSRSGEELVFLARGQHLEAINRDGLSVESSAAGDFTVHPLAVGRPDGRWKADLALFCVKSYHNAEAIEAMGPAVGDATAILTLQNGLGSGDQLAGAFGREKVLLGAVYIDAMRKAPGVVAQLGDACRIVFGEADGRRTGRALAMQRTFQRAGIDACLSSDVLKELWNKLIYICGLSGMSCITRGSFKEVMATPETYNMTWQAVEEVVQVGRASGINLDANVVEATMARSRGSGDDTISSMYLDLEAGRPLELAVLNGAVARIGREVGVATPVNDFIAACLTVADNRARARLSSASSR